MNKTLNHILIELEEFPGYFVNEIGEVWSEWVGNRLKKLRHAINRDGYKYVCIYRDGYQKPVRIHRLVAKTFIANPEGKTQADHINRDRGDNRVENLRWATREENCRNSNIQSNNTTGMAGVVFRSDKNYWIATWYDNNSKMKTKSFSVKKYPNAKELAIEHRQKMEKIYYKTLTVLDSD